MVHRRILDFAHFSQLEINQKSFSTATRNESVLDLVQETETQDYPI
jgi:hypothetical protein